MRKLCPHRRQNEMKMIKIGITESANKKSSPKMKNLSQGMREEKGATKRAGEGLLFAGLRTGR